jgi:hypothetical protein
MEAGHHRQKRLRLQLPVEAQHRGAATEPPPRRFPTIEVVRPQPLRVIPTRRSALERRHPHRHPTTPLPFGSQPQVCTRLSSKARDGCRSVITRSSTTRNWLQLRVGTGTWGTMRASWSVTVGRWTVLTGMGALSARSIQADGERARFPSDVRNGSHLAEDAGSLDELEPASRRSHTLTAANRGSQPGATHTRRRTTESSPAADSRIRHQPETPAR